MVCRRKIPWFVLLLALLGVGNLVISEIRSPIDQSYRNLPPLSDPERRSERLGDPTNDKQIDTTAFIGMPDGYSDAASKYVESIFSEIKAVPLTRRRYYDAGKSFPIGFNPSYDRDVVVPLVLLPRPEGVRTWSDSRKARSLGWVSEDRAFENRRSVHGRTLIFEPGTRSQIRLQTMAIPFEGEFLWDLDPVEAKDQRKVVVAPSFDGNGMPEDQSAHLYLGEEDGAELICEMTTVPLYVSNRRIRWVSLRDDSKIRRSLSYALLDGNGASRGFKLNDGKPEWKPDWTIEISPYVRPLVCERHQPKIRQHDELLLPTPLGWAPSEREDSALKLDRVPHEEWCLDEWFPAQKEACWVIREAVDSKPLQESFVLMPANEKSDRPVFFTVLFVETEPAQLVTELASLYQVSPDATLNSPETMSRLKSLYAKLRDFPLAK